MWLEGVLKLLECGSPRTPLREPLPAPPPFSRPPRANQLRAALYRSGISVTAVIRFGSQAGVGPHSGDHCLVDAVSFGVALPKPHRLVAESTERRRDVRRVAISDVFAVDAQGAAPHSMPVSAPVTVPAGAKEEAGVIQCADIDGERFARGKFEVDLPTPCTNRVRGS